MPSHKQPAIDLSLGWPSPSLLPTSILRDACQALLTDPTLSAPSLLYGPDPGPLELRDTLAAFLDQYYSTPWTSPARLTITGGASQSLACILQVFSDPNVTQNVYMVAPTYFLACRIFEDSGFAGRLKAVPEDEQGIDVRYLEMLLARDEYAAAGGCADRRASCKRPSPNQKLYKNVIYCVPTFSNPSGKTMSLLRREQLVRLARRFDALIVADDVYDFLPWTPPSPSTTSAPPPRLVDIDHTLDGGVTSPFGNVVSNGSFSKILGPGLRTGWTESTETFAAGLAECGSTRSGGSASQFTASVVAQVVSSGVLRRHLDDHLLPAFRRRSAVAVDAIQRCLAPHGALLDMDKFSLSTTACGAGGYYLYIHLPRDLPLSVTEFARLAWEEENVVVGSGETFEVRGDEHSVPVRSAMRLCIAWEDEEVITEGVRRLGELFERILLSQRVESGGDQKQHQESRVDVREHHL